MKDVYLDGEKVDFQGAAPQSVGAAWDVVSHYLGGQERMIDSATLDGESWRAERDADRPDWNRLEFCSVELGTKLHQLVTEWANRRAEIVAGIERLAGEALAEKWSAAQGKVFAVFDELRPLIEHFGALLSYGQARERGWAESLAARYGACSGALEAVSRAVEAEDCVALSEGLNSELAPAIDALVAEAAGLLPGPPGGAEER